MLLVLVVVMMAVFMLFVRFGGKFFKLGSKAVLLFDRSENVGTLQIVPIRCDDGHIGMLPPQTDCLCNFFLVARMRKHDAARILYLVEEELAEVFKIHFALLGVDHRAEGVELRAVNARALYGADDIGELADARGFDDNAVRRILCGDLSERLGKIADERTADTA